MNAFRLFNSNRFFYPKSLVYKVKGINYIMNTNRLWAVVNLDTNECLYSSFDYNRAKAAYDELVKPRFDEKGQSYPNIGDLWHVYFVRYDINRSYVDDRPRISPFQKSLNDDFRAFMDFCLLKRGSNKNTNTNEVKKC